MRARRFNKRIEIWQTAIVSDGFGGNTSSNTLITSSWAEIKSLNVSNRIGKSSSDFGINNTQLGVMVTVRLRNDITYNSINQYIKYAGDEYTISSFPENKNFDNSYITFIAVKEDLKSVTTISPIT